jgi:ABC-type arginine transport system permease subunit
LADSIRAVLSAAFISLQDLTSAAGGLAAAIAIGAFIGQVLAVAVAAADEGRREAIAIGGLIGLLAMIGLILYSAKWG